MVISGRNFLMEEKRGARRDTRTHRRHSDAQTRGHHTNARTHGHHTDAETHHCHSHPKGKGSLTLPHVLLFIDTCTQWL